jgi:hypothetical protein
LSEQGARRVGKDYDVEPIVVRGGVFHPKLSVLTGDDECHLLVGSGNLTFGGWGGNLEIIEHLHPSFAADAIEDAADLFDRISSASHLRHGAGQRCSMIADDLRASTRGRSHNGNIRLFHSLDRSISQKLTEAVDELGGAVRLVTAAPFWDDGSGPAGWCPCDRVIPQEAQRGVGGAPTGALFRLSRLRDATIRACEARRVP